MPYSPRLAAYLARIGLSAFVARDGAGLERVQAAHRQAIGFENLDVMLKRGIALEPDAIFAKLVTGGRGGYCFEHNALFGAMLAEMGLPNRPLLGRVWIGAPADEPPPRTHTLRLVDVDGVPWIADAGFGAAYVPALPLVDGAAVPTPDGVRHRLRRVGAVGRITGEWLLERLLPGAGEAGAWQKQYSFDTGEAAATDLAMSSHWTSTRPGTRFTTACIASIVLPEGFASLTDRQLTITTAASREVTEIADAHSWRALLAERFHIVLSPAEVADLGLFSPRS